MIQYNKECNFNVTGYFDNYDDIYYKSTCMRYFISKINNTGGNKRTVIQRFIGKFIPRKFGFKLVKKER
jgi:hypothetical protein